MAGALREKALDFFNSEANVVTEFERREDAEASLFSDPDSGRLKSSASSRAPNNLLAAWLRPFVAMRSLSISESSAPSRVLSAATRNATWLKSSGTDSRTKPLVRDGSARSSSIVAGDSGARGVT